MAGNFVNPLESGAPAGINAEDRLASARRLGVSKYLEGMDAVAAVEGPVAGDVNAPDAISNEQAVQVVEKMQAGEKVDIPPAVRQDDDLGLVPLKPVPDPAKDAADLGLVPAPLKAAKEPDMGPLRDLIKANIEKAKAEKAKTADGKPREAASYSEHPLDAFMDDWRAGWEDSIPGMYLNEGKHSVVLPKDASLGSHIVSSIATLAGDSPAIVAGWVGGTMAGAGVGGAVANVPGALTGAAYGGTAGAFAMPAAMRKILMDHYEKGDIVDAKDFLGRALGVTWETIKGGTIGLATAGAGRYVGPLAEKAGGAVASRLATPAAEIAAMTTVGGLMEGHLPNAEDFTTAAGVVTVLHGLAHVGGGSAHIAGKMRRVYEVTGIRPEQVAEDAKVDPKLRQELISEKQEIPSAYQYGPQPELPNPLANEAGKVGKDARPEPPPATPAEAKILGRVADQGEKTTQPYTKDSFYKDYFDRLYPIARAMKQLGSDARTHEADANPYLLSRVANDFKAKVAHVMERGTFNFSDLSPNGKGFNDIVKPFENERPQFTAFLVAKRALELEKRGVAHGFDVEAAKEVVKNGEAKYGQGAKELVDFQNRNLKYLMDSGRITKDFYDNAVAHGEAYVSFKRVFESGELDSGKGTGGKAGFMKAIEGSSRKIVDPFRSLLDNTEATYKLAEKNRAVKSFVDMAESEGAIRRGETKLMDKHVLEEVTDKTGNLSKNEFEVWEKGERKVYRTVDPDLAEAFRSLDGDATSMNLAMRIARGFTTVKKIGTTLRPEFMLTNVERDQLTAGVFTKGKSASIIQVLRAMGDITKKNDDYYNWLRSGGANGTFLDLNARYSDHAFFSNLKETGVLDNVKNLVKTPVEFMKVAAEIAEMGTRLAEFKRVSEGANSGEKVFKGGFAAREVTLDFQRMGAKMSALNSITAFLNVSVQGIDKTARAVKENPTLLLKRAAMYLTGPSMLLWYYTKDDERVKAIPRWERDTHWIIPTDKWVPAETDEHADMLPDYLKRTTPDGRLEINKGTVYRIAKPQELGVIFASLPERMLDAMFKNDQRAFKNFEETMLHLVTPNVMPDAIGPTMEHITNYSFFTGQDVVPGHLEGVAPELRYTEYTSESAKQLGRLLAPMSAPIFGSKRALSPAVIDNYARQWGGALGQYAVQAADAALTKSGIVERPTKADWTMKDIPSVKAFVSRYPSVGAQQIKDFNDRYNALTEKKNSLDLLAKKIGQGEQWASYFESMHADEFNRMAGIHEALNNMRNTMQMVNDNPDYSGTEKRQLLDGITYTMIEMSSQALKAADEQEKLVREAEKQLQQAGGLSNGP